MTDKKPKFLKGERVYIIADVLNDFSGIGLGVICEVEDVQHRTPAVPYHRLTKSVPSSERMKCGHLKAEWAEGPMEAGYKDETSGDAQDPDCCIVREPYCLGCEREKELREALTDASKWLENIFHDLDLHDVVSRQPEGSKGLDFYKQVLRSANERQTKR